MSPPHGRPKEGSLPLGGKARSAKGAHIGPPRGRPKEVGSTYRRYGNDKSIRPSRDALPHEASHLNARRSSMPAVPSAATSFISESTLQRMTPSLASMRWMVGNDKPDNSASLR